MKKITISAFNPSGGGGDSALSKDFKGNLTLENKKFAFTLAEVLITLAVIGVVAALTMPILIQSYKKKVIETKLQRFYSVINQAVKLAEIDNGPVSNWALNEDAFVEYIAPHLKLIEKSEKNNGAYNAEYVGSYDYYSLYLSDGSLVLIKKTQYNENGENSSLNYCDIFYTPEPKQFDFEEFSKRTNIGKTTFVFQLDMSDGFVKPYIRHLEKNYSKDDLMGKTGKGLHGYYCNGKSGSYGLYCTALIMLNGWKIPDDYPFKF